MSTPFDPSIDQLIYHRLHEDTHITPRVSRDYERQEHGMPLKGDAGGEIQGDEKHGPTCVWCSHHAIWIEPICCQRDTYITSLSSFVRMFVIKVRRGRARAPAGHRRAWGAGAGPPGLDGGAGAGPAGAHRPEGDDGGGGAGGRDAGARGRGWERGGGQLGRPRCGPLG